MHRLHSPLSADVLRQDRVAADPSYLDVSYLLHLQAQVLPLDRHPSAALPRSRQRIDLWGRRRHGYLIASVKLLQVAGSNPYLGDARVAAAQVVAAMMHPVLLRRGAVLPQEALPVLGAPPTLKDRGRLEALTAA